MTSAWWKSRSIMAAATVSSPALSRDVPTWREDKGEGDRDDGVPQEQEPTRGSGEQRPVEAQGRALLQQRGGRPERTPAPAGRKGGEDGPLHSQHPDEHADDDHDLVANQHA